MTRQHVENGERRRRRSTSESSYRSDSTAASSASSISDGDDSRKRHHKRRKEKDHREICESGKARKEKKYHRTESRTKKRRHSNDSSEDEKKKRKRLYKEAKRLLKKSELGNGAANSLPEGINHSKDEKISEEDYYLKNNEFSMWLKEHHRIFFSDLSSDESHKLFNKFVEVWNAGRLSDEYYKGISKGPRTSHNWVFKDVKGITGEDEEKKLLLDRQNEKIASKKFGKEQAALLDELLPRETGKERIMEKRALRREITRARESSPDLLSEKDILGGSDDFQKRLAHERAKREIRAKEKAIIYNDKFSAHARKEAAAMDQIRALVDSAGGKIVIPKRQKEN